MDLIGRIPLGDQGGKSGRKCDGQTLGTCWVYSVTPYKLWVVGLAATASRRAQIGTV